MAKFGLDYASLREIRPELVMISLPAFGMTGPWRDFVGSAYPTEQATGFPHFIRLRRAAHALGDRRGPIRPRG